MNSNIEIENFIKKFNIKNFYKVHTIDLTLEPSDKTNIEELKKELDQFKKLIECADGLCGFVNIYIMEEFNDSKKVLGEIGGDGVSPN